MDENWEIKEREKGREEFYQLVNKYVPPYFLKKKKKKKTRVFSLILNEFVVTCILEICLAEDLRKITDRCRRRS